MVGGEDGLDVGVCSTKKAVAWSRLPVGTIIPQLWGERICRKGL